MVGTRGLFAGGPYGPLRDVEELKAQRWSRTSRSAELYLREKQTWVLRLELSICLGDMVPYERSVGVPWLEARPHGVLPRTRGEK